MATKRSSAFLAILAAVCCCALQFVAQQSKHLTVPEEKSLKVFLQKYVSEPTPSEVDKTVRYFSASVDLNDDGKKEVLVYIEGRDWCGSAGCPLLILVSKEGSYRVVTETLTTWRPIRVLSSKTNGWHDIGVSVGGGGIRPGYEARLEFNGRRYPSNPSVGPAKRILGNVRGKVVIPSEATGTPLYH